MSLGKKVFIIALQPVLQHVSKYSQSILKFWQTTGIINASGELHNKSCAQLTRRKDLNTGGSKKHNKVMYINKFSVD